jgi:hypothetical protein
LIALESFQIVEEILHPINASSFHHIDRPSAPALVYRYQENLWIVQQPFECFPDQQARKREREDEQMIIY